jgi:hypothetical protein
VGCVFFYPIRARNTFYSFPFYLWLPALGSLLVYPSPRQRRLAPRPAEGLPYDADCSSSCKSTIDDFARPAFRSEAKIPECCSLGRVQGTQSSSRPSAAQATIYCPLEKLLFFAPYMNRLFQHNLSKIPQSSKSEKFLMLKTL